KDQPELLEHGLAVSRAIHDRYHGSLRNPYNEIECGDHYARAMASYGVFQAVCGFHCHGPRAEVRFAPRLTPERFRAPFVTPEGWGSFSQEVEHDQLVARLDLRYGSLDLQKLTLNLPDSVQVSTASSRLADQKQPATLHAQGNQVAIQWDPKIRVEAGQALEVILR
ncbi:MAG: glucosylceramidase, partial [Planctomycetales bacterium]|nr:glucosylceramidase [Planctomycetales bacterium]